MAGSSAVGVSLAVIEDGEVGASAAWGWAGPRPAAHDGGHQGAGGLPQQDGGGPVRVWPWRRTVWPTWTPPWGHTEGGGVRDPYAQTQPSIRTLMAHASGLKDFGVTRGCPS